MIFCCPLCFLIGSLTTIPHVCIFLVYFQLCLKQLCPEWVLNPKNFCSMLTLYPWAIQHSLNTHVSKISTLSFASTSKLPLWQKGCSSLLSSCFTFSGNFDSFSFSLWFKLCFDSLQLPFLNQASCLFFPATNSVWSSKSEEKITI